MKIEDFYGFAYERQLIWHKKEVMRLPPPWSENLTLQRYKFCCNYRELDAASRHLIERVINTNSILSDKIFNIILFRLFNTPNFFDKAMPPRHAKTFKAKDWDIGNYKKNDAIHVCGTMFPGHPIRMQILMTMEQVGRGIDMLTRAIESEHTLKNYFNVLQGVKGVGKFLAYQMAQDIGYIEEMRPLDLNGFVYVGPGAIEGLRLLGLGDAPSSDCYFVFQNQPAGLPPDWYKISYKSPYWKEAFLSLGNIQHSLCEFRKWVKLSQGVGRRRLYKGASHGKLQA